MPSDFGAGVVGVGFSGTAHARAARLAGARLVGVAASTKERAKEAATRLAADRGFPSALALVENADIDVVHLCVPNSFHRSLAEQALEAGKHVICEKPLAFDVDSADQLVRTLEQTGRVGTVPFVYRFYPMLRELRVRVQRGDLGRIHLIQGVYLQDWLSEPNDSDWRLDPSTGGPSRAFADIGSHWFDLVEFVLGHRITRLSTRLRAVYADRSTEDLAVSLFETAEGVLGSVVVSQVSPGRKNGLVLEVSGTEGTARFEQENPSGLWIGRRDEAITVPADPRVLSSDAARQVVAPPGHPHGYLDCVDRFVADSYAAMGGASPEGLPTFDDGRRAVRIVETALQSSSVDGAWLDVER